MKLLYLLGWQPLTHVVLGVNRSVLFNSLWLHGLQPARLLCLWNSPGKNNGVGSHSLLQGIFLTQGLNPGLLHCSKFFTVWTIRGRPVSGRPMSNMQIPHGLEKWLWFGALLLEINFSNFLETDYFSAEQTMERLCQGTAFPEHA